MLVILCLLYFLFVIVSYCFAIDLLEIELSNYRIYQRVLMNVLMR